MGKFNQMSVELALNNSYVSDDTFLAVKESNPIRLRAVYATSAQDYIYAIDDHNIIRRMKIDDNGDRTKARIVYAKAKELINKEVVFQTKQTLDKRGNVQTWSNSEWFCDIVEV